MHSWVAALTNPTSDPTLLGATDRSGIGLIFEAASLGPALAYLVLGAVLFALAVWASGVPVKPYPRSIHEWMTRFRLALDEEKFPRGTQVTLALLVGAAACWVWGVARLAALAS